MISVIKCILQYKILRMSSFSLVLKLIYSTHYPTKILSHSFIRATSLLVTLPPQTQLIPTYNVFFDIQSHLLQFLLQYITWALTIISANPNLFFLPFHLELLVNLSAIRISFFFCSKQMIYPCILIPHYILTASIPFFTQT